MECVMYPPWTMALQELMKSSAGLLEDVGRHRILSHVLSGCLPEGYLPAMGLIVTKALLSQSQVTVECFRCG